MSLVSLRVQKKESEDTRSTAGVYEVRSNTSYVHRWIGPSTKDTFLSEFETLPKNRCVINKMFRKKNNNSNK